MFASSGRRLVTLLGPGGIGKTRLAVESGRTLEGSMPGGVFFADLTSVERSEDVGAVVATAVGVHFEGGASLKELIAVEITEPTLLVVDNFEHVQAASGAVRDLVNGAAELRVLATSRTPLGVHGEAIFRVDPLAATSNGDGAVPPALQLFRERVAGYGGSVPLEGAQADAARSIVNRLDGIPLAIELVAARTRIVGMRELDTMLAGSLEAIGAGGAERPERQRTIQATIDWSLGNVMDSQRMLFRRLSGLPSGASLQLLQQVMAEHEATLLDDLAALVDNSLVRVVPDLPGGTRYRQLVPLREYGQALLDEVGESDLVMERLVDHYVDSAVTFQRRFEFDGDAEKGLRVDHANLLAAMWWSVEHGRAGELVAAFNKFWVYWFNADIGATAVDWVRKADDVVDSPYMDWFVGFYAFQAGDFETLGRRMQSAIAGFEENGDVEALARAQNFAGAVTDDIDESLRLLEAARAYFDSDEYGASRFLPLLFLSINAVQRGDFEEAASLRSELLAWAERAEYEVLGAWGHWNLALALLSLGRHEEAWHHGHEALLYFVDDRYQEGTASAADVIAIRESRRGDHAMAVTILGASNAVYAKLEVQRWFEAQAHVDAALEQAVAALGEATVAELLEEGGSLGYVDFVDLVSGVA